MPIRSQSPIKVVNCKGTGGWAGRGKKQEQDFSKYTSFYSAWILICGNSYLFSRGTRRRRGRGHGREKTEIPVVGPIIDPRWRSRKRLRCRTLEGKAGAAEQEQGWLESWDEESWASPPSSPTLRGA